MLKCKKKKGKNKDYQKGCNLNRHCVTVLIYFKRPRVNIFIHSCFVLFMICIILEKHFARVTLPAYTSSEWVINLWLPVYHIIWRKLAKIALSWALLEVLKLPLSCLCKIFWAQSEWLCALWAERLKVYVWSYILYL